ncbi:MAG: hypothetical protein D6763_05260 [Alphaproteobacteria bacterium]|nr:MAG: hypothetical protein D6763_05260 [Alphaproteobacteria bacterium]
MMDDFKLTQEEWNALKYALMQACTTDVAAAIEWSLDESRSKKDQAKTKALRDCDENRLTSITELVQSVIDQQNDIPESAPANTPKKQMGRFRGLIGKFIGQTVDPVMREYFIQAKTKKKQTEPKKAKVTLISTLDAKTEQGIFDDAINALKTGAYHQLDPVSGDASCEMRVPFLLDVYDAVRESLDANADSQTLTAQVDNVIRFDEIVRKQTKTQVQKQQRSASRYLGLCHPLTIMRTQGNDSFKFLIDDVPEKWTYSFNQRGKMKRDLAEYSVDYMRGLATRMADEVNPDRTVLTMERMVADMLNSCEITLKKSGQVQPVVPIYTAMRLILMHEIRCGRPITVTLTRIGYGTDRNTGQAVYTHCGSKVFFYRANPETGTFDYVADEHIEPDERSRPLTNFHAYNMFDLEGRAHALASENAPDAAFFFSSDWDTFETGFTACDITHLLRCWGAAHPPVPKGSNFEGAFTDKESVTDKGGLVQVVTGDGTVLSEFEIEDWFDGEKYDEERGKAIRDYIESTQIKACPGHADRDYDVAPFTLTQPGLPLFGVDAEVIDLAAEYALYKELANDWYLYEAHYAAQMNEDESTYYLDLGDGKGMQEVEKDAYNENTRRKENEKLPSCALTKRVFHRIREPIAFSPVHVFLSSYEQEAAGLGDLPTPMTKYFTAVINLVLVEEESRNEDGQLVGMTHWDVSEFSVQDPDIEKN